MLTVSSSYAHTDTPNLVVSDARGMVVRTVQFHRRETVDPLETRVTQQRFDAPGRLVGSRDPYLFNLAQTEASVPFNLSQVMSLAGTALSTASVDAGWRVVLQGAAGQLVERWDGRGSHSLTEYDQLLRPVAVRESGQEVAEHTLERFTYADASVEVAAHNLCGQLIRHDDPAGTVHIRDLGLFGSVLKHSRQFLISTDAPDWPVDMAERNALLESGDGATTWYQYAPTAELLQQIDALDNVQTFAYTVAGELNNTRLTLAGNGQTEKLLVSAMHYNASGQIESETAGNGVITRHRYDEANGRLTELSAHKSDGAPLQDLRYYYDAIGNVLSIEDAAQPIRYHANQRIERIKTYRYDTLYQLIYATGCEAKTGSGGPALPDFQPLPPDPNQLANYRQTYYYDAGYNLLDLVHVGAQAHGRILTRSRYSNRCLPERDNRPPTEEELAAGFDANGNLRELQVGQSLGWDLRNQLREVRPVVREDKEDDCERYIYDGGGQRVRKVHSSQTNARTVIREVRYLPGLEIRSHIGTGETLHVITVSAGSNSVQVLHWASRQPEEIAQDQVRYSLGDHLKSSTLELDQNADLISWEWYYAFGGTALWAGRNAIEAKCKTVHYSGKEHDATGLYCYGFRYYAPWLQRWINPDPAGYADGMNLFSMVRNNPVVYFDEQGDVGENFNPSQYLENFKYVMSEGGPVSAVFYRSANYNFVKHFEKELYKVESLSSDEDRWRFQFLVKQLTDKLYPPSAEPNIMREHMKAFGRLHNVLSTAKQFKSFDDIPVPLFQPDPRHGRTNKKGWTYKSENPPTPGSSRRSRGSSRSGRGGSGGGSSMSGSAGHPVTITPVALPSDTGQRIVENYYYAIKIINNKDDRSAIFPDEKQDEENKNIKNALLRVHPDKLYLEGVPDVAERAIQASKILTQWKTSTVDHRARSPSPPAQRRQRSPSPDY